MPNSAPNPAPAPSNEKALDVPVIWQGSTMSCEGASLLEGLHYKRAATNQNLTSFVSYVPRANDNNLCYGYSGGWRYNVNGMYRGIMPDPVVKWAKNVGGNVVNITGSGTSRIRNEIRNGNPVVT